jgi:hypothetical protein
MKDPAEDGITAKVVVVHRDHRKSRRRTPTRSCAAPGQQAAPSYSTRSVWWDQPTATKAGRSSWDRFEELHEAKQTCPGKTWRMISSNTFIVCLAWRCPERTRQAEPNLTRTPSCPGRCSCLVSPFLRFPSRTIPKMNLFSKNKFCFLTRFSYEN